MSIGTSEAGTCTGTGTETDHFKLLHNYINALILNVKREKNPPPINLIFDSGAVNGILGIGAAIYIKRLEQLGYINVKKVAGCSIGSLIGLWYVCDCPESMYGHTDILFSSYKEHKNFYIFKTIVKNIVHQIFPDDNMKRLTRKLYINYYDTKKCKQCIVSKFKSRKHLINCILRSSHVPFLTSCNYKYQGRYIDGITPHIFKKEKSLFIKLINLTTPLMCLNIKREQNIYTRLLSGVVKVNDFFINGKENDLCLYVDDKSYLIFLQLRVRKYVVFFILYLIEWFLLLQKNMPPCVRETMLYKNVALLGKASWKGLKNRLV